MKRRTIPRLLSVISLVGLAALLVALMPAAASAAPVAPHVTVFLKNYHEEYNVATADFLAAQFDDLDSPAYGMVSYTLTTTLTPEALAGSIGLVIDESADMSLTDAEAALIHDFVRDGGRVALFAFPRYYWDHQGPNTAAYQRIADIWGITEVGEPQPGELSSGDSSATVTEPEDGSLDLSVPYAVASQAVKTFDQLPFSPITAASAVPLLTSPVLSQRPVAVSNSHGIFVTNSLGDAVQGADANVIYAQFATDAIVWLTTGSQVLLPNHLYLPLVRR